MWLTDLARHATVIDLEGCDQMRTRYSQRHLPPCTSNTSSKGCLPCASFGRANGYSVEQQHEVLYRPVGEFGLSSRSNANKGLTTSSPSESNIQAESLPSCGRVNTPQSGFGQLGEPQLVGHSFVIFAGGTALALVKSI